MKPWFSILLVLAVVLAGCAARKPLAPPDIRYGEDACDQCGMIISEARYAAGAVTVDGRSLRFDDVDDLLAWQTAHPGQMRAAWVHDFDTSTWLPVQNGRFVESARLHTPMGHALVAVATPDQARRLIDRYGGRRAAPHFSMNQGGTNP